MITYIIVYVPFNIFCHQIKMLTALCSSKHCVDITDYINWHISPSVLQESHICSKFWMVKIFSCSVSYYYFCHSYTHAIPAYINILAYSIHCNWLLDLFSKNPTYYQWFSSFMIKCCSLLTCNRITNNHFNLGFETIVFNLITIKQRY